MASYQYVYHMDGLSKAYPGGKKCFENIHLNFLPGVKIGVVGVNGSGKSTLLRIMAGIDKDFVGEARPQPGIKVGFLEQEPPIRPSMEQLVVKSAFGALIGLRNEVGWPLAADLEMLDLAEVAAKFRACLASGTIHHGQQARMRNHLAIPPVLHRPVHRHRRQFLCQR